MEGYLVDVGSLVGRIKNRYDVDINVLMNIRVRCGECFTIIIIFWLTLSELLNE